MSGSASFPGPRQSKSDQIADDTGRQAVFGSITPSDNGNFPTDSVKPEEVVVKQENNAVQSSTQQLAQPVAPALSQSFMKAPGSLAHAVSAPVHVDSGEMYGANVGRASTAPGVGHQPSPLPQAHAAPPQDSVKQETIDQAGAGPGNNFVAASAYQPHMPSQNGAQVPLASLPGQVSGPGQGMANLVPGSQRPPAPVQRNGKQVSTNDIQRVQNYIEKCLQMYLSQKEVISQLEQQFKVEPCFTQLVWQKLEEQNQEFFRAYYTRLKLKDQIVLFNHLLDEQVKMFSRMPRAGPSALGAVGSLQPGSLAGVAFPPKSKVPVSAQMLATQPPPASQPVPLSAPLFTSHTLPQSSAPVADGGTSSQHMASQSEFPAINMEGRDTDLHNEASGAAQSLPYSGSELNLAGMVNLGGLGKGLLGSNDHDLAGLPRNFSLSDFGFDHGTDVDHSGIPRNISLSEFPVLDLDSGGEQN